MFVKVIHGKIRLVQVRSCWTCKIKLSQVRLGYIRYGQIKIYYTRVRNVM